jgi:lysozyme
LAFPQNSIPGIDVSHLQGVVNWPTVAASGEVFAFAKASEGITFVDGHFHDNWQGMSAAGVLRGAYHYYRANDDPRQQAQTFLQALAAANGSAVLAPGDLPAALDLEVTLGVGGPTIVAGVQTWLQMVADATGRAPLVYTYPSFWQAIGNPPALSQYPLWIAEYGVAAPKKIGGWPTWTFWQFDSKHTVQGVGTPCDADGFQGTLVQLQSLAGMAPGVSLSAVNSSIAADPWDEGDGRDEDVETV